MSDAPKVGSIGWIDLTTDDAAGLRDFYKAVVGFESEGHPVGDYEDFVMKRPEDGEPRAGICHKKGENAAMPNGWIIYFCVADLEQSLAAVEAAGGRRLSEIREAMGRFCVIADPAGNICALHQSP